MREATPLNKKKPEYLPALALVVLSILLKTILLLSIPNQSTLMEADSIRYLRISESFWTIFFGSKVEPDSFFITPGYPLFLSFFPSGNIKLMIFAQFLLLGISQIILFKLVLKYTSIKIAYFGLSLFLLESSSGLESFNLLTETLFNFIFVLFLFLLGSRENKKLVLCASGLTLGLALFVRPVGQILLVPLLLILAFKTWRKQIALVILIAVAVSSTWIIRNQIVFGVPQLSGIQSLNLLQYEGAGAFAKQNDVSLEEAQTTETQLEINIVGQNSSMRSIVEHRVDRGIELILANAIGFVNLHVEGAAKILLGPGSANINKFSAHLGLSGVVKDFLKVVIILMRLLVTFLVCLSIIIALKTRIFLPIQFYSIVSWILILMSSGGANAYSRFRVPLIPLEIIIICIGLSNPTQRAWLEKNYSKVKGLIWKKQLTGKSCDAMSSRIKGPPTNEFKDWLKPY